jgi:flavin-dependent dehydrogenase
MTERAEVVIVGGSPSGAAVATLLARAGRQVIVLERSSEWRWRACGVFASPATMRSLRRLILDGDALAGVARPVPAMRVEAPGGPVARLTYGDDGSLRDPAIGFDRRALDGLLLDTATSAGADLRRGVRVLGFTPGHGSRPGLLVTRQADREVTIETRVVVGADGIRSQVARSVGVARPARLGHRVGLTVHVADPRDASVPRDARMIVLRGAYCGLAPVPGGRVNVGIVLANPTWRAALAREGADTVIRRVLEQVPAAADDPVAWAEAERCDTIEGASPLGHRVVHRAGPDWLLVGDAAGFLDPFTGEGLHRSLASAELAAQAIDAHLEGRSGALAGYDRAMAARFRSKDLVSLAVQAFLARPMLFRYALRRLHSRDPVRETMALVMGDLVPAGQALHPRFLAALLKP